MPSPPSCRAGRPLCGASLRWAHPCGAPQPICIMRVRASRQCRCHQWLGTPAVGDTSPLNQPPGYNTHCRTDITSSLCAPTAPTGRPAIGCRSSRAAQRLCALMHTQAPGCLLATPIAAAPPKLSTVVPSPCLWQAGRKERPLAAGASLHFWTGPAAAACRRSAAAPPLLLAFRQPLAAQMARASLSCARGPAPASCFSSMYGMHQQC